MRDDPIGPLYDTAPAGPKAPFPSVSVAVKAVRAKLAPVRAPEPVWPLVGAAALCAGSALVLAAVIILGPPL